RVAAARACRIRRMPRSEGPRRCQASHDTAPGTSILAVCRAGVYPHYLLVEGPRKSPSWWVLVSQRVETCGCRPHRNYRTLRDQKGQSSQPRRPTLKGCRGGGQSPSDDGFRGDETSASQK